VRVPAQTRIQKLGDNPCSGVESGPGDGRVRTFRLSYHFVEPLVIAIDVLVVISVGLLSEIVYNWAFFGHVPPLLPYAGIGVLTATNLSAVLAARGDYQVPNLMSFSRQAREVTIIWTGIFLVLVGVAFSLKVAEEFSRGAAITFFAFGLCGVVVWRKLVAQFLERALSTGTFASRNVILIGEHRRLATSKTTMEFRRCGYTPIRTFEIDPDESATSKTLRGLQVTIEKAIKVSRSERVSEIMLLIGWEHRSTIENIAEMLSVLPIAVYLLPDDNVARFLGHHSINVGSAWAAEIQRAPLTRIEQIFKRCLDTIGAATLIVLLSPLMVMTALLIRLDSRGPVLFFQTRDGFSGRRFQIIKFRTMNVLEDGDSIRQATRDDPRVTRLGHWLRRANIDELPQLLNVLRGEMSLVGPRPHAVAHNDEFERAISNYAFRNHVKPGITGWAQVHGYRGETPTTELMARRIELDLWYINNWSIWLDIAILFRTLMLGLQRTAY
jgi:Undecaprenyl-phosphate glucose phosphotransferase